MYVNIYLTCRILDGILAGLLSWCRHPLKQKQKALLAIVDTEVLLIQSSTNGLNRLLFKVEYHYYDDTVFQSSQFVFLR